jgi:hypothetical protein
MDGMWNKEEPEQKIIRGMRKYLGIADVLIILTVVMFHACIHIKTSNFSLSICVIF